MNYLCKFCRFRFCAVWTKSGLAGEEYARCSGRTKGGDTGQRAARVFFYRAAKAAGAGFTQGREGCGGRTFGNCRI